MPNVLTPDEVARSHRWHAVECNNLAWQLSEKAERTPQEAEEMLSAAHASAFHWARAGTDLHRARSNMLLGQVYAALGNGPTAMKYAKESYDFLSANAPPDWEIAFAHAILAHAAFASGDAALHARHHAKARELGDAIADPEDKEIFLKSFQHIPRP